MAIGAESLPVKMAGLISSELRRLQHRAVTMAVFAICRNRRFAPVRTAAWLAQAYLKAFENRIFEMQWNGECEVLRRLSGCEGFTVFFDVGANYGEWTRHVLASFPEARVHCFEIAPAVFSSLEQNLRPFSGVQLNNCGLSDTNGSVTIHFAPHDTGLTSLLRTKQVIDAGIEVELVGARVETGDRYLVENGLSKLDFLKIDVEGAESLVLDGFRDALENGLVKCVQFEFGHSSVSLREFFRLFERHGFKVGKLFPDGCEFGQYDPVCEFVVANYIAVREDLEDVISALSCPQTKSSMQRRHAIQQPNVDAGADIVRNGTPEAGGKRPDERRAYEDAGKP